jgi:hypothetical protein
LLAALLHVAACGSARPKPTSASGSAHVTLVERHWDSKPSLVVIERHGDPFSALAFAGKTGAGPAATAALAEIVERRLAACPGQHQAFPSSFGLTLVVSIASSKDSGPALRDVALALHRPIEIAEIDNKLIGKLRADFASAPPASASDVALANCSGELFVEGHLTALLSSQAQLREAAERARVEIYSSNNARFALVGTGIIAHDVERALNEMPPWPLATMANERANEPIDRPPEISIVMGSSRQLSFAWRVGSIAKANQAAEILRRSGSPLLSQVSALDADWKVEAVSSVARRVGACLRIDLSNASDNTAIATSNLESLSRVAVAESRIALDTADHAPLANQDWAIDNDPERASRQVAWNSLSVTNSAAKPKLHVQLRLLPTDKGAEALETALRDAIAKKNASPIETAYRMELGQTELWSLLASPCGTTLESVEDAGNTAAWAQAISQRFSGHLGVQVEPWITTDAVGFIAHCRPQSQSETSLSTATRLGNALGSIIATGTVTGAELASLRELVLLRVGPAPRPGYWQLVDSLSSGHPATFEPLGTFDSIRSMDPAHLRAKRIAWLNGPLRLGALLNRDKEQLAALTSSLHRWLDPHRSELGQCAPTIAAARPSQDIQIVTRSIDAHDSSAYLAVHLASQSQERIVYEHWLLWLLTRPGGWLEMTVSQSGTRSSFSADIMGPSHNRSLVISLNVDDESKLADLIARLRDLLSRLSRQGAEVSDIEAVRAWSEAQIRRAELDPRRRLLDAWRGSSIVPEHKSSGFSRYLNQAFTSAAVTVLRVRRQP